MALQAAFLAFLGPSPRHTEFQPHSSVLNHGSDAAPLRRATFQSSSSPRRSQSTVSQFSVLGALGVAFMMLRKQRRQQPSVSGSSRRVAVARAACMGSSVPAAPAQPAFAGASVATTSRSEESKVGMRLLMPKNIKYKKPHKPIVKPFHGSSKWKFRGYETKGVEPEFGKYALVAMEEAWLSSKQIEAIRRVIVRTMERKGRVWIQIFPKNAITKRVAESRMGAGKGSIEYWVAAVRPNKILFELDGVPEEVAMECFRKSMPRLACKAKIIKKTDGPSLFELGKAPKQVF